MNSLEELIQGLPPDLEQEVEGFVRFLKKRVRHTDRHQSRIGPVRCETTANNMQPCQN